MEEVEDSPVSGGNKNFGFAPVKSVAISLDKRILICGGSYVHSDGRVTHGRRTRSGFTIDPHSLIVDEHVKPSKASDEELILLSEAIDGLL